MPTVIAILIIALMLGGTYAMWRFLVSKGMRAVVVLFRKHNATDPKRAATLETLGLAPPKSPLGTMFRPRDYRQSGMRILAQQGIIKVADGGRVYLSEETLKTSRARTFANID
jgi:hypothetical protein